MSSHISATNLAADASGGVSAKRAIVVGASSGMGAALVVQLVGEGYRVGAIARRAEVLEELQLGCAESAEEAVGEVLVRVHDVTDFGAVPELFEELVRALGGLDLFVFAAGIMPKVAADEFDSHKDLAMIEVNFGGLVAWMNPVARLFQSQRSGTIVGISSVAGDRGRSGAPVYGATKAAMNTYLESLRNRLGESGVTVCTIKPGFVDTAMTRGMDGLFWLISAERAAELILKAARYGATERYVPRQWFVLMTVIRAIPSFLFRKLNI